MQEAIVQHSNARTMYRIIRHDFQPDDCDECRMLLNGMVAHPESYMRMLITALNILDEKEMHRLDKESVDYDEFRTTAKAGSG